MMTFKTPTTSSRSYKKDHVLDIHISLPPPITASRVDVEQYEKKVDEANEIQRLKQSQKMPLYDCMLLFKPTVKHESIMELVSRVGKHVYRRNGVLTDVKSFGVLQLGYGIKKLDGRYYQGQLMQMTMMTPPSLNTELYYLNKEDRLLRWLLVKQRDLKFEDDLFGEYDGTKNDSRIFRSRLYGDDDDDDDTEEDENEEGNEYQAPETKSNDVTGLQF